MSRDAHSVVKNSAFSITGQMFNLLVGLVSSMYVARVLGAEQFGIFNWALGLCAIVMAISNAGLDLVITRDASKDRDRAREFLLSALLAKVISSSLCYLGILAYLHFRHYSGLQLAVGYLLCSTVITESFNASCRATLAGFERQDLSSIILVLTNLVRVAVVVFLVYTRYDIYAVAWVTVAALAVAFIANIAAIARTSSGAWRLSLKTTKYLVVSGASFLVTQVFIGLFDRADYVMLDMLKTVETVGIYSAAYRITEIVVMIAQNGSYAMFPIMCRRMQGSKESYARAVEKSTKYLTLLGVPLCTGIFLLSHQLIALLYGPKYAASGACLSLLIWARVTSFMVVPGCHGVAARNAQIWLLPPVIARAILNVGLNLYLIPRHGFIGASIAMVISENIYCLLNYVIAFRGPERFNPVELLGRPVLASAAMAAAILLLRPFSFTLAVLAAVVVYPLVLHALGGLDSDDKRILGSVVAGIKGKFVRTAA